MLINMLLDTIGDNLRAGIICIIQQNQKLKVIQTGDQIACAKVCSQNLLELMIDGYDIAFIRLLRG